MGSCFLYRSLAMSDAILLSQSPHFGLIFKQDQRLFFPRRHHDLGTFSSLACQSVYDISPASL
jgi:hypothetical protein